MRLSQALFLFEIVFSSTPPFHDPVVVVWEEQTQLLQRKSTSGATESGERAISERQYQLQLAIATEKVI